MAAVSDSRVRTGWPPVFAWIYDEVWAHEPRLARWRDVAATLA